VDWFRSPDWDDTARADFEARLQRARPHSRGQYLAIKAQALGEAGRSDAAADLLRRALEEPDAPSFEVARVLEELGDLAAEQGDRAAAETWYRRLLAEHPDGNGTTDSVEISLAEVLLDRDTDSRGEAARLLDAWMARVDTKFTNQLFRWYLAALRLAEQQGDAIAARAAARAALELAAAEPQFSRHPDVGVVHIDEPTLRRLRSLAG
jgi:tetratricopeptide (TPR) repeat protein